MSVLILLFLTIAPMNGVSPAPGACCSPQQAPVVLQKDGGPGHGVDQPYSVREVGAQDLAPFAGGKQVVFVAPYDVFLLIVLVAVIVVLIIIL